MPGSSPRPRRSLACPLLLLASLCAAPAVAGAAAPAPDPCGPQVQDRQQLATEGLRIYKESFTIKDPVLRTRELERSLRCFLGVVNQAQETTVYHPLGLVYEKLERYVEAAEAFKRYLETVPEAQRPVGTTKKLNDKLAALRRVVGELSIDTRPGLEVRVDERLVGTAPLNRLIVVLPGVHAITVGNAEVGTLGADARVEAGEVRRVDLTAWRPRVAEAAAPPREAPPAAIAGRPELTKAAAPAPPPFYRRAWFWGVLGGGVALVAGAVVLGVVLGSPAPRDPLPAARF